MSLNPDLLVERVLRSVPAASYEMSALLSVLRIEVTSGIETAAVSCERRPVLQINPEFVETWCRTDEHLFLLMLHELHHVLLGHTRLFRRVTTAHNIAFDAVINALLCHRFPQQAYTSFFSNFYANAEGPVRLLAPPDGRPWPDHDPLEALHHMLYAKQTVSAAEVFDAIVRAGLPVPGEVRLLGSHGEADRGSSLEAELATQLESLARQLPQCEGLHAGGGGDLVPQHVDQTCPSGKVLAVIRRALLSAATGSHGSRTVRTGQVLVQSVLPTLGDRRALVARAAGHTPLLFDTRLESRTRHDAGRASIYIDVSGSMTSYLPWLYGALNRLRQCVEPRVHLFSTVVHTIPLDELLNGARYTTGGNDFDCVVSHAIAHPSRRALILTDGYVGRAKAGVLRQFQRRPTDFRVLLTPGSSRADLKDLATAFYELPALN